MEKISFVNDYSEGCHAEILKALIKVNYTQSAGYGLDDYSIKAKEFLKKEMANDEVSIHFVSGGTQANLTVIAHLLRPYEAVVACDSGHINVHESGSIEMCGRMQAMTRDCHCAAAAPVSDCRMLRGSPRVVPERLLLGSTFAESRANS